MAPALKRLDLYAGAKMSIEATRKHSEGQLDTPSNLGSNDEHGNVSRASRVEPSKASQKVHSPIAKAIYGQRDPRPANRPGPC